MLNKVKRIVRETIHYTIDALRIAQHILHELDSRLRGNDELGIGVIAANDAKSCAFCISKLRPCLKRYQYDERQHSGCNFTIDYNYNVTTITG